MSAYLVAVYTYPDRNRAKRDEEIGPLGSRCATCPGTENDPLPMAPATTIHDTPPVVLSGLVRGGEIRNDEDWWSVWPVAGTYVLTDSSGRFVPCTLAAVRAALPVTWYRYEEP